MEKLGSVLSVSSVLIRISVSFMISLLAILHYFFAAVVDGLDKFLMSKRKIQPASYTFWSIVTGLGILVAWPWVFERISLGSIVLDLLSGVLFSLALYVFLKALSEGEVSRVIPFVFGLVPVFDLLIAKVIGQNPLLAKEISAMFLLVPGALIISYRPHFWGKHALLKVFSAFLWSANFALWQFVAEHGNTFNHFMYNRLGAALVLVVLLVIPAYKQAVFKRDPESKKKGTVWLFLFKQALGGANMIFFSWLIVAGKIPLINSLQGFRYVFLFIGALFLSKRMKHLLEEGVSHKVLIQKICGLILIVLGTLILFL